MAIQRKNTALLVQLVEDRFFFDFLFEWMHSDYTATELWRRRSRALFQSPFNSSARSSNRTSPRFEIVTLALSVTPISIACTPFAFAMRKTSSGFGVETRMREGPS